LKIKIRKTYKILKRKLQVIKEKNYKCLLWDSEKVCR